MMVGILLLGYGGLALWLGFTVGHRMRRFSALIWAHDQVMAMWRRALDAPEPTTLQARHERIATLVAYRKLSRRILREAKREGKTR
jgi:hypothetical protein